MSKGPRRPASAKPNSRGLPSREAVMAFIRENPDRATKRDIAKAFNLKGDDRVALKLFLKELEADGIFERRGKRLQPFGALPPVAVLSIIARDRDGGLMARPVEWDEQEMGDAPRVLISLPTNPRSRAKVIIPGIGDRVLARIGAQDEDGTYSGRVIKRLEKPKKAILGVVRAGPGALYRIEPTDRKQDELEVSEENLKGAKPGDLVEISVVKTGRYGLMQARVEEILGSLSSEKAVSMIAIHAHGIPHVFDNDVLDEAASVQPPNIEPPREDWRSLPLITIDPATAKDHDDAVHAEPDTDPDNLGGHIVTVAIADVAYFVRPGSALDREALKRGNSVYFPDRVVPMLPERISNDLCSLRENVDRPAMAVRMVFDAQGHKRHHTFHRIMMRSHAKLAYEQAQAAIDGATDDITAPILETILKPLWAAYRTMQTGRDRRAPLELDLPERKILLKEDGTVDKVVVPPRLDAHKLIEECMIQANVAAAETLEAKRQLLMFRVHDAPALSKQESLREFLKTLDLPLARGGQLRPSSFNALLKHVEGTEHAELVNAVVLRSQSQAEYSPDNYGHFGLNLQKYAHFTSPIRRYADLIVHRALIRALGLDQGGDGLPDMDIERLREIGGLISATERRAVNAERDTVDRLIAEFLHARIGDVFDGRVTGVTSAGLFVILPQFGADGFVPISTLGDEYFIFDEGAHCLVGERSGLGFRLGDSVEVRVAEVQSLAGSMRFEIVSEPRKLPFSRQSRHKSQKAARRGAPKNLRRGAGRAKKRRS